MEIGILLLRLRKERRLSQAEVAEQLGISQSAYCSWESEKAIPGVRYWPALAAFLGVELRELLAPAQPPDQPVVAPPPAGQAPPLQDEREELLAAQREIITLQKLRLKRMEAENQQLQQLLRAADKLTGGSLLIIFALNFSSFLLEIIGELIVIG